MGHSVILFCEMPIQTVPVFKSTAVCRLLVYPGEFFAVDLFLLHGFLLFFLMLSFNEQTFLI